MYWFACPTPAGAPGGNRFFQLQAQGPGPSGHLQRKESRTDRWADGRAGWWKAKAGTTPPHHPPHPSRCSACRTGWFCAGLSAGQLSLLRKRSSPRAAAPRPLTGPGQAGEPAGPDTPRPALFPLQPEALGPGLSSNVSASPGSPAEVDFLPSLTLRQTVGFPTLKSVPESEPLAPQPSRPAWLLDPAAF